MGAMVGCESPAGYRADPRACRAPASVGVSQSRINTLHADALQVDGDMVLTGAVVTGSGELGALRLPGAHIAGRLVLVDAVITNESGPPCSPTGCRSTAT
jgi:hypothetical protein